MIWPRLRKDPMVPEKGGAKRAKQTIRRILGGEGVTIRLVRLGKGWGAKTGMWMAWVEECGEDEFGMCHIAGTPGLAIAGLSHGLHRVTHVCSTDATAFDRAYTKPGWAYGTDLPESTKSTKSTSTKRTKK